MRLTKAEREAVRSLFGGHCAYCGNLLGERWHADHVEAVLREWWKRGGGLGRPQHDHIENIFPACVPCNIDKHAMQLEDWRGKLQRATEVLSRNHSTYRHAKRFGLLQETGARVVFFFEKPTSVSENAQPPAPPDDPELKLNPTGEPKQ